MSEVPAPKKVVLKPTIIISNKNKMVINSPNLLTNVNKVKLPLRPIHIQQYKNEVVYAAQNCDFLKGESQDVLIVNRLNLYDKSCRTVAKLTNIASGHSVETTSDNVAATIGQKNYETVLSALSSVFNEETKVRGILSLLSLQKTFNDAATQTTMERDKKVIRDHKSVMVQTDDSRLNLLAKEKPRKRVRRLLTPYVVTENPKIRRCVINLNNVKKNVKKPEENFKEKPLPDLKAVLDEDSNISGVSDISASSWPSLPGALEHTNELLHRIDKVTDKTLNSTKIRLRDDSEIMIPVKPEDDFHIATPEVLKNVTHEERMKLIWHQAFIDFKLCLKQDEDGYYPLHVAVLNNDVDLVRRMCASLKARRESVDIPASAAGLTALHMAVQQNVSIKCTNILLQNGADPLLCDQERRTSLHLAAEQESAQLMTLLNYCDKHARRILKNNQGFWRPEFESKPDFEIMKHMHNVISEMFDDQGHSPLMAAAEAAIPSNVSLLASRAGPLIDAPSPDSGATALYRAVAKACLHAKETGNTTKTPEKYLKTIEILVELGADPSIENHSGSSVNTLLTEFNISSLSMTIANTMTALKHGRFGCNSLNMILYKNSDGRIDYKDINDFTDEKPEAKTVETGLHAVVTVDIPEKKISRKSKVKVLTAAEVGNLGQNKDNNEVNTTEIKHEPKNDLISTLKSLKVESVISKEINTNNVSVLKNAEQHSINDNKSKNNPDDKIANIVWKAKPDAKVNLKDTDTSNKVKFENTNALKLNLKNIKNGNLGNVTFKRLSSGQMIAVAQAKSPEGVIPSITDKKISLIKIYKSPLVPKNKTENTQITKSSQNNELDDTSRSAKDRKIDNVVIVENVPVKSIPLHNITPSTSKLGKAKDIVISKIPRNINEDLAARELSMEDISPIIVIGKEDVTTVKNFRKRKLNSE